MHVLVAPDKFAGTLTAEQAAAAIAAGWMRSAPTDTVELLPLADGGPGFIDAIKSALGGRTHVIPVTGPLGGKADGRVHVAGGAAYIEAADACGLHLVPPDRRDPEKATSFGVGELFLAGLASGAQRIVVGLGGSATNDAGTGMLAALGAEPVDLLRRGAPALLALAQAVRPQVDVEPARRRVAGVEIVIASDVDNILSGSHGATVTYGPQKGATPRQVDRLDAAIKRFARLVDWRPANQPGAGAAGGLGYALLALGAQRLAGAQVVLDAVGAFDRVRRADLVLTGEGSLDWQSMRGKVVTAVARTAQTAARPCVVLAGQVTVGRRELAAMGADAAYSAVEVAGSVEAALADPAGSLADLAERVARTWSR